MKQSTAFTLFAGILILLLATISTQAQSPQKFSSQIVIRDATGDLVSEAPVQVRITIIQGEPEGFLELQEVHSLTTNVNGLASFEIGAGTWVFGFIEAIDWSNGPYFIQTEVDPTNSSNYTISSTTELLSVPYALYAKEAGSVTFETSGNVTRNSGGDYASDDFVFGSPTLDSDGNLDHDARMFFDKDKAAFRVGYGSGPSWDDQNVGFGSIALGFATIASGVYSIATGHSTNASGGTSTAIGYQTTASGLESTAIGHQTTASGFISTAIGHSTSAQSFVETVVGSNNTIYTPQNTDGWNDLDRLFVIGNGTNSSAQSDAMVVLKNGNVGLGTSTPNEVLEIAGDGRAFFGDGGGANRTGILIDGDWISNANRIESYDYSTNSGMDLVFNDVGNGDVGIKVSDPNVSLDVSGSIEYTGTITDVSDERLKENFESIDNALESITQLQGYSYNMKDDEEMTREYGVIAQEVQKVFPEMVTVVDEEEGYLGVSYVQLIPVLLEAIKELKEENELLQTGHDIQTELIKSNTQVLSELKAVISGSTLR